MRHFRLPALLAFFVALTAHAGPEAPASARDLHVAECVAALGTQTETLAEQVKAGKEEARPLLLKRLESGTAFVGDNYLHGDSDETRARALVNEALGAQKALTANQLAARQALCAAEGARLLAASNGFERAIVKRLARKRMDRLLGS